VAFGPQIIQVAICLTWCQSLGLGFSHFCNFRAASFDRFFFGLAIRRLLRRPASAYLRHRAAMDFWLLLLLLVCCAQCLARSTSAALLPPFPPADRKVGSQIESSPPRITAPDLDSAGFLRPSPWPPPVRDSADQIAASLLISSP
jgi:hypothetical protein